ncbi:MAG: hypothetical protein COZ18_04600 [Flexibacter sp. CG_4_10_14_3_um_filter_32_15]|nr:MAG: hypothetical protein COZ18_04600 [Flexibacter sp. CG_4_10_14_3_um_filter_32_15]
MAINRSNCTKSSHTDVLKKIINGSESNYYSFSKNTTFYETTTKDYRTFELALKAIGVIYKNMRENNIVDNKHSYTKRQFFAAPIIVKSGDRSVQESVFNRHSKPYFMSVMKTSKGFMGTILFIPYDFARDMPTDRKIRKEILKENHTYSNLSNSELKGKYDVAIASFTEAINEVRKLEKIDLSK